MNTRQMKPGRPYRVMSGRGTHGEVRKGDILVRTPGGVQYFPQGRGFPVPPDTPWFQVDRLGKEVDCDMEIMETQP